MPIAHVHIMQGRSDEQKEAMIREVSEALARTLDSPLDRVRVLITEVPNRVMIRGPCNALMNHQDGGKPPRSSSHRHR